MVFGDTNGDGYSDLIASSLISTNTGSVYILLGSASGLNYLSSFDFSASIPTEVKAIYSTVASHFFGRSLATGDFNRDGLADLIIGSDNSADGRGYLYYGSSIGILSGTEASADKVLGTANSQSGYSVAAGDINGDGYDDAVIAAKSLSLNVASQGGAYIYHVSSTGINDTTADTTLVGDNSSAFFGAAVSAGDYNGDGYCDLAISDELNTAQGRLFIFDGSATGIANYSLFDSGVPTRTIIGESTLTTKLGAVISSYDINGDGFSDLLTSGYGYNANRGITYIFNGNTSGILGQDLASDPTADTNLVGALDDSFGISISK